MKRALTLIPIVGIFTTGILVCVPKSASAYCVHNKAAFRVHGVDTRKQDRAIPDKYWEQGLNPGAKDCCPGDKSECQGATIKVTAPRSRPCEARVDARGWIVVHSISTPQGLILECRVREPV
jgi:hypothetical protein